jgi:putative ABC transport system ATP-binding protein
VLRSESQDHDLTEVKPLSCGRFKLQTKEFVGLKLSEEAIVAQGVTKYFGEGSSRMTAVDHVQFVAHFGEMVFIVGPSGSGKTTFLSLISGILRPDEGKVLLHGEDLWGKSPHDLALLRLHKIGFVFQDFHLFPRLSTVENVAVPLILRGSSWDESLVHASHMLEAVNMSHRADVMPVKLSGGEQQRVAIARAMVGEPDVLVLDEPTASLDGDTGKMIIAFVKEKILNPRRCILIVTHDARINEYADRIVHMENGRITSFEKGTE